MDKFGIIPYVIIFSVEASPTVIKDLESLTKALIFSLDISSCLINLPKGFF
jgi:hypothetical protein